MSSRGERGQLLGRVTFPVDCFHHRIVRITEGDYDVDLGAQWVQGAEGNVLFDLVDEHGLLETTNGDLVHRLVTKYVDSSGNAFDNEAMDEFDRFYWECLGRQPYASCAEETSTGLHLVEKWVFKIKASERS